MHAPVSPGPSLLQRFVATASAVERQPWIDQRSITFYALLACAGGVELAVLLLSDVTFDSRAFQHVFASLLVLLGCGLVARRYGLLRIATALEMLALPSITGALVGTGAFMVTPFALPLADRWLGAADRALGFDWLALFRFYQRHPEILPWARRAYFSMVPQLSLVPLVLVAVRCEQRAWTFLTAYAAAGVITVAVYVLAPAAGPFILYGITPSDLPNLRLDFAWSMGPSIEAIRSGTLLEITRSSGGGLVSMPSFHAASATLLAWAILPVRWVRVPLLLLNFAMLLATPIIGSHYFVDVLAGAVVAMFAIRLATVVVRNPAPN